MSVLDIIARLTAGLGLMLANAFFVSVEFALTRLRQFSEADIEDHGGLARAWEMTNRLEIYLTGCQLGISVSSILLGVVAEPALTFLLQPVFARVGVPAPYVATVSVVLAVVFINLAHKIWGEQAPTYLGVERPLDVARVLAPILYWWTKVTYPFIYLGDGLAKRTLGLLGVDVTRSWTEDGGEDDEIESRHDMKRKVAEMLGQGALSEERRREVMNALEIGERQVGDIMIARDAVVAVDANAAPGGLLDTLATHEFVRYPVVENDEPFGILYAPGLFRHLEALREGTASIDALVAEPVIVAEDLSISAFVDRLQEAKQEAAFVSRNGAWVGFATVTDAFEAVLGDLEDPFD